MRGMERWAQFDCDKDFQYRFSIVVGILWLGFKCMFHVKLGENTVYVHQIGQRHL